MAGGVPVVKWRLPASEKEKKARVGTRSRDAGVVEKASCRRRRALLRFAVAIDRLKLDGDEAVGPGSSGARWEHIRQIVENAASMAAWVRACEAEKPPRAASTRRRSSTVYDRSRIIAPSTVERSALQNAASVARCCSLRGVVPRPEETSAAVARRKASRRFLTVGESPPSPQTPHL